MSDQDEFARILASLYQATLDDRHWPVTSALIDEACGITGNCLLVGEGPPDDIRAMFVGVYARGERQADLEREYLQVYHPIDEAVPRLRQLPDSQLVPIADLYTAEELKRSPSYNDILRRAHYQQGLNVRLDGPDRSHMTWGLGDPVASEGWGVGEDRAAAEAAAPDPALCVRPAGAGPGRGAGHDRGHPAGESPDWGHPPGPARADPGGQ